MVDMERGWVQAELAQAALPPKKIDHLPAKLLNPYTYRSLDACHADGFVLPAEARRV
jgi:hypothetical protein